MLFKVFSYFTNYHFFSKKLIFFFNFNDKFQLSLLINFFTLSSIISILYLSSYSYRLYFLETKDIKSDESVIFYKNYSFFLGSP